MIELRHLRYFVAVAEELNFRRAAEKVHIDQTPLSRAVRDLEEELGVQLFIRTPRRLLLTPAGARLLEEARKLFIRFERTKRVVRQTDALYQAPLRIGVADGIAQPRLAECVSRWQAIAPEIPVELSEMWASELVVALMREDVDIGISFGVPDVDGIGQDLVWSYPLMAVLPLGHELALSQEVALSDVASFPLITTHPEFVPGIRHQLDVLLAQCGHPVTIAGEAATFHGFVNRIASGLGVGVADSGHADTLRRDDLLTVRMSGEERIHTYVLHKHRRFDLPPAIARFLAHAKSGN